MLPDSCEQPFFCFVRNFAARKFALAPNRVYHELLSPVADSAINGDFSPFPIDYSLGSIVSVALSLGFLYEQKTIDFLSTIYILVGVTDCLYLTPKGARLSVRTFLPAKGGAIILPT